MKSFERGRGGEVAPALTTMSIEKRLHPRILVEWPAAVKTLQGTIEEITKDISVDGVFSYDTTVTDRDAGLRA